MESPPPSRIDRLGNAVLLTHDGYGHLSHSDPSTCVIPTSEGSDVMSRRRLQTMSAVVFAVLTIVTALWPDWIEELTGLNPDAGSGALEWAMVAAFALVALVCGALALRTPLRIRGAQR